MWMIQFFEDTINYSLRIDLPDLDASYVCIISNHFKFLVLIKLVRNALHKNGSTSNSTRYSIPFGAAHKIVHLVGIVELTSWFPGLVIFLTANHNLIVFTFLNTTFAFASLLSMAETLCNSESPNYASDAYAPQGATFKLDLPRVACDPRTWDLQLGPCIRPHVITSSLCVCLSQT